MENETTTSRVNTGDKFIGGLTWSTWLWIGLFVFVAFTRFHHLGDKPFHHDESLYAKYIWNFHTGQGYQYDPMQHGPFLFHVSQLVLFLFGVSNYTIRIVPALTGICLIGLFYLIRRRLPPGVALMTGWLFAINSVFMYFQRFLRHDPLFSLFAVVLIYLAFLWFKDRKAWQYYTFCATAAILYCIKENAFVHYLTMYLFMIIFALYWMLGQKKKFRDLLTNYPLSTKTFAAVSFWGVFFVVYALVNQFGKASFDNWEKALHTYWIIVYVVFFTLVGLMVYLGELVRIKTDKKPMGLSPEFFRDSHVFAIGTVIFFGIIIILYTTLTFNPKGFWGAMYEWYTYWLHQHSIARIAGPFHYYHHQMLIYAFLPLAVTIFAVLGRGLRRNPVIFAAYIIGTMILFYGFSNLDRALPGTKTNLFTNEHLAIAISAFVGGVLMMLSYLRERMILKSFLIWWITMAYIMYSYLQEKVPWLVMHIITPMILYAALVLMEAFQDRDTITRWMRRVIQCFFAIMVIYALHTSFQLCWWHEADPVEQMVYVQTTYEVPMLVEEMERIAYWQNTLLTKELPMVINGHATWPLYWYLRDWSGISYGTNVNPATHLMVICNWEDRYKFAEKCGDQYVARQYGLRAWFLPKYENVAKGGKFWRNAWKWIAFREKFDKTLYGSQQICVFTRKDVSMFQNSVDLGTPPKPPEERKPPRTTSIQAESAMEFGLYGSQSGRFNTPKDISVDSSGNIYVADMWNHRIQKFAPDGKFLLQWGSKGSGNGEFNQPTGIGIGSKGQVFVADTWNHRIQKFDENGKFIMTFGDDKMLWAPKDVMEDDDGYIYVSNTGFHKIMKFTRSGSRVWEVGEKGSGPKEFTEPVGMCMDKQGLLYVADTANKRISVFDKSGNHMKQIAVYGLEEYYSEPFIMVDSNTQRIYMTDSRNNRIQIFDLNGNLLNFWGSEGSEKGQFRLPTGIFIAQDKVYVTEAQNHRVQVFNVASLK
ncbi:TIGR03663 family protein [bacterium]|nr:TIGR03663 family protein [candidate division CSSED10-310 bacterium]